MLRQRHFPGGKEMRTGRSLLFVAAIFFLLWAPVMASAETIDQVADAIISAYNQYHSTYSGQALYLLQAAYVHAVAAKQYEPAGNSNAAMDFIKAAYDEYNNARNMASYGQ